jgi:predicted MPP superfamily phosphohydrolase
LLHIYAYLKCRAAVDLSRKARIFLAAFIALMIASPLLIRMGENAGLEMTVRILSYICYLWMGILFLFIAAAIFFDLFRILVLLISFVAGVKVKSFMPSAKLTFYIPLCLALIISIYGYFEARSIKTEHITISSSKIPAQAGKLRIVQISDVHIGLIVRNERLRNIIKIVQEASPDIFVSTGDLVDGQINRLAGLSELLDTVKPQYGKYAITGNHEFYAGLTQALSFTERAGFKILRGETTHIGEMITITGVDDKQAHAFGLFKGQPEGELLAKLSQKKFNVLLKHRPVLTGNTHRFFDLQLSGHTHKGQIFPFSLLTRLYFPFQAGHKHLNNNSHLYVSRGTGTWGPPVRFLSQPEVTIIDLVHE